MQISAQCEEEIQVGHRECQQGRLIRSCCLSQGQPERHWDQHSLTRKRLSSGRCTPSTRGESGCWWSGGKQESGRGQEQPRKTNKEETAVPMASVQSLQLPSKSRTPLWGQCPFCLSPCLLFPSPGFRGPQRVIVLPHKDGRVCVTWNQQNYNGILHSGLGRAGNWK